MSRSGRGGPQRALSRVTFAQVVVRRPWPATVQALALSEDPVLLGSTGGSDVRLQLSFQQQYQLVEADDPERGPWKVATRAYRYELADTQGRELAGWHWHRAGQVPGDSRTCTSLAAGLGSAICRLAG